ncbi:hypothetical protein Tco_0888372 [Tanacetum coccineum]
MTERHRLFSRVKIATGVVRGLIFLRTQPQLADCSLKIHNILLDEGNVGLIFTKGDLKEVNEEVAKYKIGAPARVGLVAPVDVVVPPANTGLDPSQTSFFQLIKKGDKVGSSEALEKILEQKQRCRGMTRSLFTYKELETIIVELVPYSVCWLSMPWNDKKPFTTKEFDDILQGNFNRDTAWKVVELAIACVSYSSIKRPTMNDVVMELKYCLQAEQIHRSIPDNESVSMNLDSMSDPMPR